MLNKPLPQKEIEKRKKFLKKNISDKCVGRFAKIDKNLCPIDKMQRRLDNLYELGFDAKKLAEKNPTILRRTRMNVRLRFFYIGATFGKFDPETDIKHFFMTRPQLWSVGANKLNVIVELTKTVSRNVTPGRFCNIITLNLEDVLLAYINGYGDDLIDLHREARNYKAKKMSLKEKRKKIINHCKKLPQEVFALYKKFFLR